MKDIEAALEAWQPELDDRAADRLLSLAEDVLCCWLHAHDKSPTHKTQEGFRLLALQRQGAQGDPSFNACRETCREIVYRYNLIALGGADAAQLLVTLRRLVQHLAYFVSGKMAAAQLGEFCCSSRPLREADG